MRKALLFIFFLFLALNLYGKDLQMAVLDVGQGLCCVVISPDNHCMVFDCGTTTNQRWKDNMAVYDKVLNPYLKKNNVKKIDYLILSHPDFDHYCGLVGLLQKYPVSRYINNGGKSDTIVYKLLEKELQKKIKKGMKVYVGKGGDQYYMGLNVKITLLAPPYKFKSKDKNDLSVMAKVQYGDISFLLTGDCTHISEEKVLRSFGNSLKSQVLVVGHHGSHTSTSYSFLKKVRPKIALISCGRGNPYGHPHREVLADLKRIKANVYRTDKEGSIICKTNGKNITVERHTNQKYKGR